MNGHLLPDDMSWHDDKALITELTPLIAQLSKYVMRYFDADAGQAEPVNVEDERALAEQLAALAVTLQTRADRRTSLGDGPLAIEGGFTPPAGTDGDTQLEQ